MSTQTPQLSDFVTHKELDEALERQTLRLETTMGNLFSEWGQMINDRFDKIEKDVHSIKTRLKRVENKLDFTIERTDSHAVKLDKHETAIRKLKYRTH